MRYRKWRKNGAGVSPVIAVILMVAITVVLAAVLYTLVGIIVDEPPEPPQTMGATLERVDTGWKVTVIQGSVSANETNYFVEAQNGSIAVKKDGIMHNDPDGNGKINAGDSFFISDPNGDYKGGTFKVVHDDDMLLNKELR